MRGKGFMAVLCGASGWENLNFNRASELQKTTENLLGLTLDGFVTGLH